VASGALRTLDGQVLAEVTLDAYGTQVLEIR
jgi:hypothetical protein